MNAKWVTTFKNAGVSPGLDGAPFGALSINGDFDGYTGTTLRITLGTSNQSSCLGVTNYMLLGDGDATGDELIVTTVNGLPATDYNAGDSFTILTVASMDGWFDGLLPGVLISTDSSTPAVATAASKLPTLAQGLAWMVTYDSGEVVLHVVNKVAHLTADNQMRDVVPSDQQAILADGTVATGTGYGYGYGQMDLDTASGGNYAVALWQSGQAVPFSLTVSGNTVTYGLDLPGRSRSSSPIAAS